MNLIVAFAAGVWLAVAQEALDARLAWTPDLLAVALAGLLLRLSRRRAAARCFGVVLGWSALSMEPLGAPLLGAGVAALVLVPLRDVVFVESPLTQAFFGAAVAAALGGGRWVYAGCGLAPVMPWSAPVVAAPLLTAIATPILLAASGGIGRSIRWVRARIAAWRAGAARDASP